MRADGLVEGASTTTTTTTDDSNDSDNDNNGIKVIRIATISNGDFTKRYSAPLAANNSPTPSSTTTLRQVPKSKSLYEYGANSRVGVRHRNAEEALSSLLWQPYECRGSPPPVVPLLPLPLPLLCHQRLDGGDGGEHSSAGGRDGESWCANEMRIQVPAPAPAHSSLVTECSVHCDRQCSSVSVNGEVMSACRTAHLHPHPHPHPNPHPHPHPTPQPQPQPQPAQTVLVPQQQQQQHQQQQSSSAAAPQLLPPPYSTLPPPPPQHQHQHHPLPLPVQPHGYPFQPITLRRCQYGEESEGPKTCCGGMGARALGLRWFIAVVALAGVCCVLVGTVLGAVRAQGRAHLTVLLVMIGVGLVLVTVSGVAWRAAGRRANSVTGGAANRTGSSGPRRTALPCARAHHPYAAMLYPEFHCRPPPPSYQASMHDYRLRLLLLDRATSPPPVACPPPAYRPRRLAIGGTQYAAGRGTRGRRRPEQQPPPSSLSAVVIQNIGLESYDDIKYDDGPEIEPHIVSDCKDDVQPENKEGNLVTIVQTGEDSSPVIVTVSGSMPEERTSQVHTSEIDILAHL